MPTRTARGDDDLVERLQLLLGEIQAAELREPFVDDESAAHGVLDRLRLLEDLLEHEVLEAALLDLVERPIDAADAFRDTARVEVEHLVAVLREHAHLAVVQVHDLSGVLQDRRGVARDVVLVVTEADEQRTAVPRADDLVGVAARDDGNPVRALNQVERVDHAVFERVAIHRRLDQMREHFRVRLGLEGVPLHLEHLSQRAEVLDNAVVDDGDLVLAVDLRMRVALVGRAVGCPARMGYAHRAVNRIAVHDRLEHRDLALGLARLETMAIAHRDAR